MVENPTPQPQVEAKQRYETFTKELDGKVTLHFKPNSSAKEVQAPTVWNGEKGIREWDKDWTVKRDKEGKQETPLTEYILEKDKLKKMLDIGWKKGIITVDNIRKDPINPKDPYEVKTINYPDGTVGEQFTNPYDFLIGGDKNTPPEFPATLTEKQTFDLMLLIYKKAAEDPFKEVPSQDGNNMVAQYLGNHYVDDIMTVLAPEVNKYENRKVDYKDQVQWLTAMNISTRKALDAWVLAESYSPTERVLTKLQQRMTVPEEVTHGVSDRFTGEGRMGTNREVLKKIQEQNKEPQFKSEANPTFEIDMMMARALEVAIPPDELAKMEKYRQSITEDEHNPNYIADYKERGKVKVLLEKERQKWEMAVIEHFGYTGEGKGFDSWADYKTKYFSQDEVNDIADYKTKVAKRIESLGNLQGEFGNLNPVTANLRKTQDVVVNLLDDQLQQEAEKKIPAGGKNKLAHTPTTAEIASKKKALAKELKSKVKDLLDQQREIGKKKGKLTYKNTFEEIVDNSNILNGLEDSQKVLVRQVLVDALKTKTHIEGRMTRLDAKEGGSKKHEVTDYAFNLSLEPALKGTGFMLKNILTNERATGKEYPGFKQEFDSTGAVHLKTTVKKGTVDIGGNFNQNGNTTASTESSVPSTENQTAEKQKKLNELSVELAKAIGIKDNEVSNLFTLTKELGDAIVWGKDAEGKNDVITAVNLKNINLDSAVGLEKLSKITELYPDAKIQIDSLNLTTDENTDIFESPIRGFSIESFVIDAKVDNSQKLGLNTEGSEIRNLWIIQGDVTITTDKAPERIKVVGQGTTMNLVLTEQSKLDEVLSDASKEGTVISLDNDAGFQVNLVDGTISIPMNTGKVNEGETKILIKKDGIYQLADSDYEYPEAETAPPTESSPREKSEVAPAQLVQAEAPAETAAPAAIPVPPPTPTPVATEGQPSSMENKLEEKTAGIAKRNRAKLKKTDEKKPYTDNEARDALEKALSESTQKQALSPEPPPTTAHNEQVMNKSRLVVETKENESELQKQREVIFNKPVITADGEEGIYRGSHYAEPDDKIEDGDFNTAPRGINGVMIHIVEIDGVRHNYLNLPSADAPGAVESPAETPSSKDNEEIVIGRPVPQSESLSESAQANVSAPEESAIDESRLAEYIIEAKEQLPRYLDKRTQAQLREEAIRLMEKDNKLVDKIVDLAKSAPAEAPTNVAAPAVVTVPAAVPTPSPTTQAPVATEAPVTASPSVAEFPPAVENQATIAIPKSPSAEPPSNNEESSTPLWLTEALDKIKNAEQSEKLLTIDVVKKAAASASERLTERTAHTPDLDVPEPPKKQSWLAKTFPKIFGKKQEPVPSEPVLSQEDAAKNVIPSR